MRLKIGSAVYRFSLAVDLLLLSSPDPDLQDVRESEIFHSFQPLLHVGRKTAS